MGICPAVRFTARMSWLALFSIDQTTWLLPEEFLWLASKETILHTCNPEIQIDLEVDATAAFLHSGVNLNTGNKQQHENESLGPECHSTALWLLNYLPPLYQMNQVCLVLVRQLKQHHQMMTPFVFRSRDVTICPFFWKPCIPDGDAVG